MDDNIRRLILEAIDETISADDFELLQSAIEQDDDVRAEYLQTIRLCQSLEDVSLDPANNASNVTLQEAGQGFATVGTMSGLTRAKYLGLALATGLVLCVVSAIAYWAGQKQAPEILASSPVVNEELHIAGHAALRRSIGLKWPADAVVYRQGDVLPNGQLRFEDGLAEIDFFCGATLIVEGPATLDVESDWSVRVIEGRLRANVPPAARGFIIKVADSEIIDLGTEFALEVSSEMARVEVLDGEIKLQGGDFDGARLLTGQSQILKGPDSRTATFESLSTVGDIQRLQTNAKAERFATWQATSEQLALDERLIAYYPIGRCLDGRVVRNEAASGGARNAQLVGPVSHDVGRLGMSGASLNFDRPGARVRTRIDGTFSAFTFACWVRIDSLEHAYNALFMSDGYENGELHWQIRKDGRLMFSVMVDESQKSRHFSKIEQQYVETAGLAKLYFTEPIWDISKSGQWFHLAAVYDPGSRKVDQFVNGKRISSEAIPEKFFVDSLKIGPAEIGNWGQPFRKTPEFAVRNLNGAVDELAIFDARLTPEEIHNIYEQGKPLGY